VLSQRLAAVRSRLAELDSQLRDYRETVPRITLIETEYQHAVIGAEARWLSSVLDDLKSRKLTWDHEQIAAQAAQYFSRAAAP
jgi:hypothetical protein